VIKATDYIPQMIELIKTLEKKGFTYRLPDGIYFDTSKLPDYGKLTGMSFDQMQNRLKAGARVEMVTGKKHPTDFALWKFDPYKKKTERGMNWWFEGEYTGQVVLDRRNNHVHVEEALKRINNASKDTLETIGFPGWHIECSAMSMAYLGPHFDIHSGGVDHIQVHHSNEIAQSEAATGEKFVNFWVHGEHLLVDGQKMSKSLGNFYTLTDVEKKGFESLALRYLFWTASYRQQMNFTWKALKNAQNALNNLRDQILMLEDESGKKRTILSDEKMGKIDIFRQRFNIAVNDDLNTAQGLSVLWEVLKSNIPTPDKYDLIMLFDEVLGLDLRSVKRQASSVKPEIPEEIKELVKKREEFRMQKKFDEADKIREDIYGKGYEVEDMPGGPVVKKK